MKGFIPVSAVCAAGAAVAIGLTSVEKMPQLAFGGDALSVAFGGAKNAISDSMLDKADSYFHGGVDVDCDCRHDHHHHHYDLDGDGHGDHDHGKHDHGHDEHDDEGHDDDEHGSPGHDHHDGEEDERHSDDHDSFDPWAWINEHVQAPQIERHLEGEKGVELMPWFWVSVKANPHNIEAWTTALFIADTVVKNEKLAARILEDAKRANPDSLDIAFAEGQFLYHRGSGDAAAAEEVFKKARLLGLSLKEKNSSSFLERDSVQFLNVLDYLSFFAAKRGDASALAGFLEEARSVNPNSVVTKKIGDRISALETKGKIR